MSSDFDAVPRLHTIPISHYCEKARWALDRAGIRFVEIGHAPLLHWRFTLPHGSRTVPLLIAPGVVLRESRDILRWVDARTTEGHLYPNDPQARREVEELETYFDAKLGPATRRWAYFHVLPERRLALEVLSASISDAERTTLERTWPVISTVMRRGMKIDTAGAERSLERVRAIFAEIGHRVRDGRRFLVGDRFSAADLTFSALAIPVLAPPQFPFIPPIELAPEAMRAGIEALRATDAGRFALRIYREERPRPRAPETLV